MLRDQIKVQDRTDRCAGLSPTCPFDRAQRRSAFHALAKNAARMAAFMAS